MKETAYNDQTYASSNRTFMELKLAEDKEATAYFKRSNRTFMELK